VITTAKISTFLELYFTVYSYAPLAKLLLLHRTYCIRF